VLRKARKIMWLYFLNRLKIPFISHQHTNWNSLQEKFFPSKFNILNFCFIHPLLFFLVGCVAKSWKNVRPLEKWFRNAGADITNRQKFLLKKVWSSLSVLYITGVSCVSVVNIYLYMLFIDEKKCKQMYSIGAVSFWIMQRKVHVSI